jgi:hypothetical protein
MPDFSGDDQARIISKNVDATGNRATVHHSLRVLSRIKFLWSVVSGDSPDNSLLCGFIGRNRGTSLSLVAPLLVLRTDKLVPRFLPSRVKSNLVTELTSFFNDFELKDLRVRKPSKFMFLCGGYISRDGRAQNLRDYLYRVRRLSNRFNIVLAERATQLYRDSQYGDLISFEEDIARIASLVLVIAESPGSLAELGAFTANDTIQKSLRVMIQQKYDVEESFVRYGPVERVKKAKRANPSGLSVAHPRKWNAKYQFDPSALRSHR